MQQLVLPSKEVGTEKQQQQEIVQMDLIPFKVKFSKYYTDYHTYRKSF